MPITAVVYYKIAGKVPGTLMDETMLLSYDPALREYYCHAPITAEMFHAALASGAVLVGGDPADARPSAPPLPTPSRSPQLRLVR